MRFAYLSQYEFLTLGGITILFFIISFAQFKLPHYINILVPLYAILTASFLHSLYRFEKHRIANIVLGIQYFILGVVFIFCLLVCFYVFKFEHWHGYLVLLMVLALITYFCLKREAQYMRIITLSVCSALLLNGVLNTHFYPRLLEYQAGSTMATKVSERNIPVDRIYKISKRHTWAMDFYNQEPIKIASIDELLDQEDFWLYATDNELDKLNDNGFHWHEQITVDHFRITRLQIKFLNPTTRQKKLGTMHLVHIKH